MVTTPKSAGVKQPSQDHDRSDLDHEISRLTRDRIAGAADRVSAQSLG